MKIGMNTGFLPGNGRKRYSEKIHTWKGEVWRIGRWSGAREVKFRMKYIHGRLC
jgi:hypothetical protein